MFLKLKKWKLAFKCFFLLNIKKLTREDDQLFFIFDRLSEFVALQGERFS